MTNPVEVAAATKLLIEDIKPGQMAEIVRTLRPEDLTVLAALCGAGPDASAGSVATSGHEGFAASLFGSMLFARLLADTLPGPGSTPLAHQLTYLKPIVAGDTVRATVEVVQYDATTRRIEFTCRAVNQNKDLVISGSASVEAPVTRAAPSDTTLPELAEGFGSHQLLSRVRGLAPIRVAVVHPCDAASLGAALAARSAGFLIPLIVAPAARVRAVAQEAGLDISALTIEDVAHSHAAAQRSVELAASGAVDALMKGSLHTDELMAAVVAASSGLRTDRRISHCFLMQSPAYDRPFIITDAAINIAPGVEEKVDIIKNAIDLAHLLGLARPRVALLSAVETVNPHMRSTLDAAILSKMADRRQIEGAIVDGPLAFDNAISSIAARIKGIDSPVSGHADVLVVPDIESGNMLVKQLEYLGGASSAGVVLGTRVPIILTSRADSLATRQSSCALAQLMVHSTAEAAS